MPQIDFLPFEEFASDAENNLGRANGNVYQRLPGVENRHDGQIMVRLKKKRYCVLDYSFIPTEADMANAALNVHVKIPTGAGKAKCLVPECTKIGVPVCVYDSEPNEPDPLYLRSGRCFQCQRDLNEKRRTEKKRPSVGTTDSFGNDQQPSLLYALGPIPNKRFKIGGSTITLRNSAVIVNGGIDGVRMHGPDYGYAEIAHDLRELLPIATQETLRLLNTATPTSTTNTANFDVVDGGTHEMHNINCKNDSAVALGREVLDPTTITSNGAYGGGFLADTVEHVSLPPYSQEEINEMYQNAFQSINKVIFLLSQWKASWDANITTIMPHETSLAVDLADAVASAAAMVTGGGSGHGTTNSDNLVSLLLEADRHNHAEDDEDRLDHEQQLAEAMAEHVQQQVDQFEQEQQQQRQQEQQRLQGQNDNIDV